MSAWTHVLDQDLAPALLYAASVSIVSPVSMRDVSPVEDDVVTQKIAIEIPVQQGHSVEVVENGSLTIDPFKVNVSMPFLGSMEATGLIHPCRYIPVRPA
ncbi:hypothetical protein JAAARDRAFT_200071 [Jaapia argillacea MUCL 33604]|uniref:Uncharacterized protein n=1 Tax=Jaapia argillacea MUCL 33604 TaxID=933084 RepID=A0A067PIK3_9AGAM|nr:hypothetical protein JAAARDRAFT_200071 [Jaapia argillacea MUCL 33604]